MFDIFFTNDCFQQHEQQLIEKAQALITRERQEKAALDDFAQRQMSNAELVASK